MPRNPRSTPHQRPPKEPVKRTATSLKPGPPPPPDPPKPPGQDLADFIAPEDQRARLSMAGVVLKAMDIAQAKGFALSDELMAAGPIVTARFLTSPNARKQSRGMQFLLGMARVNLARFAEANKTEMERVEKTQTPGDTYNIVINPPPGATGGLPFPVTKPKKVENEAPKAKPA